ncbi:polyketide cyclase [Veronia pacifica]|uniref:Polyketide cyclase n=2 Tax=Veronia pacifica TaxID=1080227 RepID=A0A1C3E7W6_9GAMM|nr:polyketide cyclase [Veronia pacifica]
MPKHRQWRMCQRGIHSSELPQLTDQLFADNAVINMCFPFGTLRGASEWIEHCFEHLISAVPDLERRDTIVICNQDQDGHTWIGCCGFYCGTFSAPLLQIPPTGQFFHMRFHEFYRLSEEGVVEVQAIWDLVEVMMQANAWPMVPSLAREGLVPGPATCDGIKAAQADPLLSASNVQHVIQMLEKLQQHPSQGGPEVMSMNTFWHPHMTWYGPAGIGTCRGLSGFRHWHQIPFLNAMPDRGQYESETRCHFFAHDNYVAVTGWPNMAQTLSSGGWLGIAPSGQKITLRSLDFWRIEDKKIVENWVLVDLLDVYDQLGVDVFARLKEFNKSRPSGPINLPQERL